jgi:hypothetical protein
MKIPPDKLILALALLILGATGISVALLFPSHEQLIGQSAAPKTSMVPKFNPAELDKIRTSWNPPLTWSSPKLSTGQDHSLFVSRPLLYFPENGKIIPVTGDVMIEDKFPLHWIQQYQIDYGQPGWRQADPDMDGFSNELEFDSGTNPKDPESHPPFISRLRLKKYVFKPFRIRFQAVNQLDGVEVYQINLKDVAARKSRFVKTGDEVEGFKVGEYRKKIVTQMNPNTGSEETKDLSELELYNPIIDYKVVLIIGTDVDSRDSAAEFIMLLPGETSKPFEIKRGKIQSIRSTEYLLKDVSETGAVLIRKDNNETLQIPMLKDGEVDSVPVWASSPPVK